MFGQGVTRPGPTPATAAPPSQPRTHSNVSAMNPGVPTRQQQPQPQVRQQQQQGPPPQQHQQQQQQQRQRPPSAPPARANSMNGGGASMTDGRSLSASPAAPSSPQSARSIDSYASSAAAAYMPATPSSRSASDAFFLSSSRPSSSLGPSASPPLDPNRRQPDTILRCINNSQPYQNPTSTATTYGAPQSNHLVGRQPTQLNWGPPLYPQARINDCNSISSLYRPIVNVPFAPPPTPPQNIGDDPLFFELYKVVWTTFHPIHDGIERPAVQALLPPRVFWMGKRVLDIGCGAGKLCRQFRSSHALQVTGIDMSARMIAAATAREFAEETDRAAGDSGNGIGQALRRFFSSTLTEAQLTEKLAKRRSKMQARRDAAKLAAEDAARVNIERATSLAAATAELDRERERVARANNVSTSSVSLSKEASNFFKKLLRDGEKLEPSTEADAYKLEAAAKRLQREHEERLARASASPAPPSAANTPQNRPRAQDASSALAIVKRAMSLESDPFRRDPVDSRDALPFVPVKYIQTTIEDWDATSQFGTFGIVTCTMTMQFVWDLQSFAKKVYSLLAPNGLFVASVDHPVATACWGIHPIAFKADPRQLDVITHFPLDNYSEQGERQAKYYKDGVIKYHRRMDTYLNTFLAAGFVLEKMMEPRASVEMEAKYPELKTWRRRPIFLCMRFRKPKRNDF